MHNDKIGDWDEAEEFVSQKSCEIYSRWLCYREEIEQLCKVQGEASDGTRRLGHWG